MLDGLVSSHPMIDDEVKKSFITLARGFEKGALALLL